MVFIQLIEQRAAAIDGETPRAFNGWVELLTEPYSAIGKARSVRSSFCSAPVLALWGLS
jgi:hypothetical protein